jgi:hypothetical protein
MRTWTLRLSRLSYAHAPKTDAIRGCDPYFKITVGGVERKTSVKQNAHEGVYSVHYLYYTHTLFPTHTQDRCPKEDTHAALESWLTIDTYKHTRIHTGSWTGAMPL